jgi:mannose-6-phosphate isomerase-like protein (cupin superfamily)
MSIVTEIIDAFPVDNTVRHVQRNEELLLTKPQPGAMRFWRDYDLLGALHFPLHYIPAKFAPPVGVYESDYVRIEYQKMNSRQPFYHRNADVDEISYHVAGERTLITEKGSVDLHTGDFARIPVSVAHDNRGVNDVHLLFYIPAPVRECVPESRHTKHIVPPFEGWQPKPGGTTEMMTECLGAIGCDVGVSLTDEIILLDAAKTETEPIQVIRASGRDTSDTEWLYKSELVWIGSTTLSGCQGKVYRRHRRADEIQCQISGHRTLVTQRGTIDLEPGDFIMVPLGTAFTDIVKETSVHISVLTRWPAPPKTEVSKVARETTFENVKSMRAS